MIAQLVTAALIASVPATSVQADSLMREAAATADSVWVSWGVIDLCSVDLRVYTEPEAPSEGFVPALARGRPCVIYVDRSYRNAVWRVANSRKVVRRERLDVLASVCATFTHERGHTLGLGHSDTGIMKHDASVRPWLCQKWACSWLAARQARKRGT